MPYKEKPIEKKYYRLKEVVIDSGLSTGQVKLRCKMLGINHLQIPVDKVDKIVSYKLANEKKHRPSVRVSFTPDQYLIIKGYSDARGMTIQEAIRHRCFR